MAKMVDRNFEIQQERILNCLRDLLEHFDEKMICNFHKRSRRN